VTRRSMTAYGRALHQSKLGRWTVDIHSVNRKGLDLNIQLPSTLLFLDPVIRKWVGESADRGQITVRVSFEFLQVDESVRLLKTLKQKWEAVATGLGFDKKTVDLRFLLERVDPAQMPLEEKPLADDLEKTWKVAVKNWIVMKEKEGKTLIADIEKRMEQIKKELQKVQKLQPMLQDKYRKKIKERMKELKVGIEEERLLREAAILAEKADTTEEITRLYSHLEQMQQYIGSKEKSVGRTLDFLAQEMGREIGTLMAKAGETAIAKIAVGMKSEIEKIREQVQNIE
jgi:uncharacterized protein (TIGR00255 family)